MNKNTPSSTQSESPRQQSASRPTLHLSPAVFWMVWYTNSNRIRRRHPTRESAELEAERLAAAYPDRTFYVLHSGKRFGKPERAR